MYLYIKKYKIIWFVYKNVIFNIFNLNVHETNLKLSLNIPRQFQKHNKFKNHSVQQQQISAHNLHFY